MGNHSSTFIFRTMKKELPRLSRWILKRVYGDYLFQEISGDFEEVFNRRVESKGRFVATLGSVLDAFLSIRNIDLKAEYRTRMTPFGLWKSYALMALRMVGTNLSTSLISIFGLAIGIGCAITAFLWADFQANRDNFHSLKESTFQIVTEKMEEHELVTFSASAAPLKDRVKSAIPEVKYATQVDRRAGNVKVRNTVFQEQLWFVDNDFFRMFDFKLLSGSVQSFTEPEVILSEPIAEKYFGDIDPIGETLEMKLEDGTILTFSVGGVLATIPTSASFKPTILINSRHAEAKNNWDQSVEGTFITLDNKEIPEALLTGLEESVQEIKLADNKSTLHRYSLIPLTELSKRSEFIVGAISRGSSPGDYLSMAITGGLLVILACFNYLNVAISLATKRLKEIALRKTMGGNRGSIISQFLIENLVVTALAMVAGILLCYFLLLPGFNYIAPVELPFAFSSLDSGIMILLVLWLVIAFLSGAYPAYYISKYQPIHIFRGNQQFGGRNLFSRVLLTIQLFISFTTVIAVLIFLDNAIFIKDIDWGYGSEDVLSIKVSDAEQYRWMEEQASLNENIVAISGAAAHVGLKNKLFDYEYLDHRFKALQYDVSPQYLSTIEANLLEGSYEMTGQSSKVVVNEAFVKAMDWQIEKTVGQQLELQGQDMEVIAVVGDIRHVFFSVDKMRPMVFQLQDREWYPMIAIKAIPGKLTEVDESLQQAFYEVAPNDPYDRVFQERVFDIWYENVDANIKLMATIGLISILLTCMGLYGLLSYRLYVRRKEFGIRKTMGAGKQQIVKLAFKEYRWIFTIAIFLGIPLGTWGIQGTITQLFTISKPFTVLPAVYALLIIGLALLLTFWSKIQQTSNVNPVEVLKE